MKYTYIKKRSLEEDAREQLRIPAPDPPLSVPNEEDQKDKDNNNDDEKRGYTYIDFTINLDL